MRSRNRNEGRRLKAAKRRHGSASEDDDHEDEEEDDEEEEPDESSACRSACSSSRDDVSRGSEDAKMRSMTDVVTSLLLTAAHWTNHMNTEIRNSRKKGDLVMISNELRGIVGKLSALSEGVEMCKGSDGVPFQESISMVNSVSLPPPLLPPPLPHQPLSCSRDTFLVCSDQQTDLSCAGEEILVLQTEAVSSKKPVVKKQKGCIPRPIGRVPRTCATQTSLVPAYSQLQVSKQGCLDSECQTLNPPGKDFTAQFVCFNDEISVYQTSGVRTLGRMAGINHTTQTPPVNYLTAEVQYSPSDYETLSVEKPQQQKQKKKKLAKKNSGCFPGFNKKEAKVQVCPAIAHIGTQHTRRPDVCCNKAVQAASVDLYTVTEDEPEEQLVFIEEEHPPPRPQISRYSQSSDLDSIENMLKVNRLTAHRPTCRIAYSATVVDSSCPRSCSDSMLRQELAMAESSLDCLRREVLNLTQTVREMSAVHSYVMQDYASFRAREPSFDGATNHCTCQHNQPPPQYSFF